MRGIAPMLAAAAVILTLSSCASSGPPSAASGSASTVAGSSTSQASGSVVEVSPAAALCPAAPSVPCEASSPAPSGQLFVAGSPAQAILCRSVNFVVGGGAPPPPTSLLVTGAPVADLIRSLNALVPTNDELPCPAPQQTDWLLFAGHAGVSSTVRVDRDGGCDFVWSDTGVHAYATPKLLAELDFATASGSMIVPPESSAPAPDGSPTAVPGPDDGTILTGADVARIGLPLPFPGEEMTVSTAYLAVVANSYLGIYTGVSPTDTTQGVIVVASQAADAFKPPFAAPGMVMENGTGSLSISRVNGAEATLKDAHGLRHTFNLQTHSFS
jgi:hypothetical protein